MADLIGKFRQMAVDYKTREALVTFAIKSDLGTLEEYFKGFGDKLILIKTSKHSATKTRNANNYYWHLVEEITKIRQIDEPNLTKEEVHRALMQDYGTWDKWEDGTVKWRLFPKDRPPVPDDGYFWDAHTEVTVKGEHSGEEKCKTYIVIKGSSNYNRAEMSQLIDGTVSVAKEMGIPTVEDKEIERLLNAWEAEFKKREERKREISNQQ